MRNLICTNPQCPNMGQCEGECVKNFVPIEEKFFILRFHISSQFAGSYVDLDGPSGGYPYAVASLKQAKVWGTIEDALDYAKSFQPGSTSYSAYAIEQCAYEMTLKVDLLRPLTS